MEKFTDPELLEFLCNVGGPDDIIVSSPTNPDEEEIL